MVLVVSLVTRWWQHQQGLLQSLLPVGGNTNRGEKGGVEIQGLTPSEALIRIFYKQ